jgi:DNA-binding transcriptional MerR regulator
MKVWLEWLQEIQEAKKLGLTTKEIREWLDDAIKEKNELKKQAVHG